MDGYGCFSVAFCTHGNKKEWSVFIGIGWALLAVVFLEKCQPS